jgi:hypothetical protein
MLKRSRESIVEKLAREAAMLALGERNSHLVRFRKPWIGSERANKNPVAPLVPPIIQSFEQLKTLATPVITFLDEDLGTDKIEEYIEGRCFLECSMETFAEYIECFSAVIVYHDDYGKTVSRIVPAFEDNAETFLGLEVVMSGVVMRITASNIIEVFTELVKLMRERILCRTCTAVVALIDSNESLGTYGIANMFMTRIEIFVSNIEKNPCSCGQVVPKRVMGILTYLGDGLLGV